MQSSWLCCLHDLLYLLFIFFSFSRKLFIRDKSTWLTVTEYCAKCLSKSQGTLINTSERANPPRTVGLQGSNLGRRKAKKMHRPESLLAKMADVHWVHCASLNLGRMWMCQLSLMQMALELLRLEPESVFWQENRSRKTTMDKTRPEQLVHATALASSSPSS